MSGSPLAPVASCSYTPQYDDDDEDDGDNSFEHSYAAFMHPPPDLVIDRRPFEPVSSERTRTTSKPFTVALPPELWNHILRLLGDTSMRMGTPDDQDPDWLELVSVDVRQFLSLRRVSSLFSEEIGKVFVVPGLRIDSPDRCGRWWWRAPRPFPYLVRRLELYAGPLAAGVLGSFGILEQLEIKGTDTGEVIDMRKSTWALMEHFLTQRVFDRLSRLDISDVDNLSTIFPRTCSLQFPSLASLTLTIGPTFSLTSNIFDEARCAHTFFGIQCTPNLTKLTLIGVWDAVHPRHLNQTILTPLAQLAPRLRILSLQNAHNLFMHGDFDFFRCIKQLNSLHFKVHFAKLAPLPSEYAKAWVRTVLPYWAEVLEAISVPLRTLDITDWGKLYEDSVNLWPPFLCGAVRTYPCLSQLDTFNIELGQMVEDATAASHELRELSEDKKIKVEFYRSKNHPGDLADRRGDKVRQLLPSIPKALPFRNLLKFE